SPAARRAERSPVARETVRGPAARETVPSQAARETVPSPAAREMVRGPAARETVPSQAARKASPRTLALRVEQKARPHGNPQHPEASLQQANLRLGGANRNDHALCPVRVRRHSDRRASEYLRSDGMGLRAERPASPAAQ